MREHRKKLMVFLCVLGCFLVCLGGCSSKKVEKGKIEDDYFDDGKGVNWCSYKDVAQGLEKIGFKKTDSRYISNMEAYKQDVYTLEQHSGFEVNVEYFEDDEDCLLRKLLIFYGETDKEAVVSVMDCAGFVRTEDYDLAVNAIKQNEYLMEEKIDSALLTVDPDDEIGYTVDLSPTNPRSKYEVRVKDSVTTE